MAATAAEQARRAAEQAAAELRAIDENEDEIVDLQISRDEETGTLGVDIDEWQGKVTVGVIRPSARRGQAGGGRHHRGRRQELPQ